MISTKENIKKNKYKFGRHRGTRDKLEKRYQTYFDHPIILYFRDVTDYVLIENMIKIELDEYRTINKSGSKSEWVCLDLSKIIMRIDKIICTYVKLMKLNKINNNIKSTKNICDIVDELVEIDIDQYDIDYLLKKNLNSDLSESKQMVLKKYFFMKTFGITNSNKKSEFKRFIEKYYSL